MSSGDVGSGGGQTVPLRKEPGVYLLYRGDRVVYVGESWNCLLGVAEQTRKDKTPLREFDGWTYIREPDERARRARVRSLVAQHSPEYNRR
jgi:hypothetical protein